MIARVAGLPVVRLRIAIQAVDSSLVSDTASAFEVRNSAAGSQRGNSHFQRGKPGALFSKHIDNESEGSNEKAGYSGTNYLYPT